MTLQAGMVLEGGAGRFVLESEIGGGGFGVTWRARREGDQAPVVVKVLRLDRCNNLKALELFEREAAVLRSLSHPGIPAYVDSFTAGTGQDRGMVLVQEFVDGRDLARRVRAQERLDEGCMLSWFAQMLGVLDYLHRLSPPVIHRDVNPKNIVLRDDGRAFLVDFGTVQAAVVDPGRVASTAAGTFGYAPMEQFLGRATPASDLHGLAMSYLAVATGREPEELPVAGNRVDVRAALRCDARLLLLLEAMTEPDPERRLGDAREALARIAPLLGKHAGAMVGLAAGVAEDSEASSPPAGVATAPATGQVAVFVEAGMRADRLTPERAWRCPGPPTVEAMGTAGLSRDGRSAYLGDSFFSNGWRVNLIADGGDRPRIGGKAIELDDLPKEAFWMVSVDRDTAVQRAVSPDGALVASADGAEVEVAPTKKGAGTPTRFEADASRGLEFSPDGAWLACRGEGKVVLYSRDGGHVELHGATDLSFHPGGRVLALVFGGRLHVGAFERMASPIVWRPTEVQPGGQVTGVRFHPDGRLLGVVHHRGHAVSVVPVAPDGTPGVPLRCEGRSPGHLALLGFAVEPDRVVALGPPPRGRLTARLPRGVVLWAVSGALLGSLHLREEEDEEGRKFPVAISTRGLFWWDRAREGPWVAGGTAIRSIRTGVADIDLLDDAGREALSDLELRESFLARELSLDGAWREPHPWEVAQGVRGPVPADQEGPDEDEEPDLDDTVHESIEAEAALERAAVLREEVVAPAGGGHLLPAALEEATRVKSVPRFGEAPGKGRPTPEAVRQVLERFASLSADERRVMHEDMLRRLRAEEEEGRRAGEERRRAASETREEEAAARYAEAAAAERREDRRWFRRKDYSRACALYRLAMELGHPEAAAALARVEEKLARGKAAARS